MYYFETQIETEACIYKKWRMKFVKFFYCKLNKSERKLIYYSV